MMILSLLTVLLFGTLLFYLVDCTTLRLTTSGLPAHVLGLYTLLADDSYGNYTTTTKWQPRLYNYQSQGFNVFWFTFINPQNMTVPKSFESLVSCRGKNGCPSNKQLIIFSIGGQLYSQQTWPWLQTQQDAQSMAQQVAGWFDDKSYGIDGIDIDIEGTAADDQVSTTNIVYFINELKSALSKKSIPSVITVPVYGHPQLSAENEMVNCAFCDNGECKGNIDSVGIMVYNNSDSLEWVGNYTNGENSPNDLIDCDVPINKIIVGIQGKALPNAIESLANSVIEDNLRGIMVWYGSVFDETRNKGGLTYGGGNSDASTVRNQTGYAWETALKMLESNQTNITNVH